MIYDLLTHEELRALVERLLAEHAGTQTQVARELDVTPGAISHAKQYAGASVEALQMRIVRHLTGVHVERRVGFRVPALAPRREV
jgi:predicted transcriptional regulator